MRTKAFWIDALERAVKTAAQTAVGVFAGLQVTMDMDWATLGVSTAIAVALSFVTSILSSVAGSPSSASLVDGKGTS